MKLYKSCMGRLCALYTASKTKNPAHGHIYNKVPPAPLKKSRPTSSSLGPLGTDGPWLGSRAVILALVFSFLMVYVSAKAQQPEQSDAAQGQSFPNEQPIADTNVRASAFGGSSQQPLHIGDAIPDELWNLPLEVVNHPQGKETITNNCRCLWAKMHVCKLAPVRQTLRPFPLRLARIGEAKREEAIAIARELKKEGLSNDFIAKTTKLTIEQIEKLK